MILGRITVSAGQDFCSTQIIIDAMVIQCSAKVTTNSLHCTVLTPLQMHFICYSDYKQYSILDINECLINRGGCSDMCTNTWGSFKCTCRTGFTLNVDGRTCNGNIVIELIHKQTKNYTKIYQNHNTAHYITS